MEELPRTLVAHGISLADLERQASQIVLFGSRAGGVARTDSDWDLLCIGEGVSTRSRHLDLVWIPAERIVHEAWLGSELATHVAAYGRWLAGEDTWSHRAHVSAWAAEAKRRSAQRRLGELERLWPRLLPSRRAKHLRRLRREVQRFELLRGGHAVPPSRILDEAWDSQAVAGPRELLARLRREPSVRSSWTPCSADAGSPHPSR